MRVFFFHVTDDPSGKQKLELYSSWDQGTDGVAKGVIGFVRNLADSYMGARLAPAGQTMQMQ